MAPQIDHSPEAARGLLQGLFGWAGPAGELIEVSIKSPRGKWHSQHWDVGTLTDPETVKQLAWWSSQGREIYVGAVGLTSRPEGEWRRGGAALRGHAGALWLDVDCEAPGREGADYFASIGDAVEVIDAALGPVLADAAVVVGSGWGVQYWLPLAEPVPGEDASRLVRVLVGWLGEMTAKKIDRVWDLTRVMRMPGTLNWRAGPDEDEARPTGVIRWPDERRAGSGRLGFGNVIAVLGDLVTDVWGPEVLEGLQGPGSGGDWAVVEWLLERYAPGGGVGSGGGSGDGRGSWAGIEVVGDLNRIATETLLWSDVLIPHGWRQLTTGYGWPSAQSREQVWERPGKDGARGVTGERSAVVYADRPELLVVYSDSALTGFSAGLMGSGRRGTAAGVGVISKWRAWVDLAWGGDERAARTCVQDDATGARGSVAERLGKAWRTEMDPIEEWGREREYEALRDPWSTNVVPVVREPEPKT